MRTFDRDCASGRFPCQKCRKCLNDNPPMKGLPVRLLFAAALLLAPTGLLAQTNCDTQPKPAFSCPPGYGIMCIPTGGDHWGCGRENAVGDIEETTPVAQEQVSADPVVAAPP